MAVTSPSDRVRFGFVFNKGVHCCVVICDVWVGLGYCGVDRVVRCGVLSVCSALSGVAIMLFQSCFVWLPTKSSLYFGVSPSTGMSRKS